MHINSSKLFVLAFQENNNNLKIFIKHPEFERKELTQNTPPFQAQHWKILLTIRGSLSCFRSILWALLCARTLLALLRRCSSLFCWIRASSFEMVQIPQMESLIPLPRSWRKVLTLSAISSPPRLSTTQKREKHPKISHHEEPAAPSPTADRLGPSAPGRPPGRSQGQATAPALLNGFLIVAVII